MIATPFITLVRREVFRFLRLFRQTVIPPVISTLLYILIFGYSLGKSIKQIEGFDYVLYILPGLAQMGVINHAYQNSSTSLFMSKMERSIENFLVAPLSYLEIVSAFIFGSIMRGLTVGIATLLISYVFVPFPMPHIGLLLISWIASATLFGCLGVIVAMLANSWDHIALIGNFIIMPLTYLGGTFYSIKLLPPFWQTISYFNPIFYCIDSTRYAVLGTSDAVWYHSFLFLVITSILLVVICVRLFKTGKKTIS